MLPSLACILVALSAAHGPGETWNRFRGPDGAGLASGVRLPDALDPAKNMLWSADLPPGHSSPCMTDERVFVTGASGKVLATVCLERASGKVLWTRAIAVETLENAREGNGPASPTPATDGQHVIAYFGSFGLVGYDLEGQELWRRALPIPKNTFGTAASPVVVGGKLIFLSDADEGSCLEAIEPASGATLWRAARARFKSGWSTPGVWTRDGAQELLVLGELLADPLGHLPIERLDVARQVARDVGADLAGAADDDLHG